MGRKPLFALLAFLSALSNAASARYAFLLLYVAALAAFCLMRLPGFLELREVRVMVMVDVTVLASLAVIQFVTNERGGRSRSILSTCTDQNSLAYLPKGETLKRAQGTFFRDGDSRSMALGSAIVFLFACWCAERRSGAVPTLLAGSAALIFTFTRSAWLLTALACASSGVVLCHHAPASHRSILQTDRWLRAGRGSDVGARAVDVDRAAGGYDRRKRSHSQKRADDCRHPRGRAVSGSRTRIHALP